MNFIIRIILITILIITIINECKGDDSYDKLRLADLFNKLKEEKNSKFELPDENCVKNYFNLPQNDKMIINPIEIIVMMTAATLKCLEDSQIFNLYFDILANEQRSNLICFKHYLVKYELDSKFIENFVISDDEIKRCEKEIPLNEFEEMSFKIERIAGSVDDLTCRSVAGINEILKLAGRVADITLGNYSDEFKKIETNKTKQLIKEIVMTTAECLMKRFENDPKAFHINDTLNYYYIESLKPFTPRKNKNNNTSIYYEKLHKLETNFDEECIKEKLNLPENGQKVLLKIEAMTIITSAKLKCIKIEKSKFFEEFLKFSVEDDQKTEDKIACAKYGLRNRGINTKLSQTIIDYDYDKICNENYIYINLYVDFFLNLRESNEKLEESTCGVYDDDDDRDKLYFTTLLLAVEKNEDLRKSEIERFSTLMIAKLHKLADCFLGRT